MARILLSVMAAIVFGINGVTLTASDEEGIKFAQSDSLLAVDSQQLLKIIRDSKSELTLLNFWATWCKPCLDEFPDIVTLSREYKSDDLSVIFVSADFENNLPAVRQFINKQQLTYVTYYKSESDNIFINALNPEWSGALPATFIYDATGRLLDFWVGKRTLEELKKVVGKYLNVTPKL